MYLPIVVPDGQDDGCSIHWTKIIDSTFRLRYRSWYSLNNFHEIWLDRASKRTKKKARPEGIEYEDAFISNMSGFVEELCCRLSNGMNKRQAQKVFREVLSKYQVKAD